MFKGLAAFPMQLFDGQSFIVHWRCMNHAEQSTIVSSHVVTVDVTPPVIERKRLARVRGSSQHFSLVPCEICRLAVKHHRQ